MLKKLLGVALAAAVIAPVVPSTAEAQVLRFSVTAPPPPRVVWRQGFHPYPVRFHDACQRKSWRLDWFDRNARSDGYYSRWEREERRFLIADLNRTCGGWRWRS